ncbi:MAG: hypothetical protein ACRCWQ_02245 [Bacilli bacterium]
MKLINGKKSDYAIEMDMLPDSFYEEERARPKIKSVLFVVCYVFYFLITYSYFEIYGWEFVTSLDLAYVKSMGIVWVGHVAIYCFKYFTQE